MSLRQEAINRYERSLDKGGKAARLRKLCLTILGQYPDEVYWAYGCELQGALQRWSGPVALVEDMAFTFYNDKMDALTWVYFVCGESNPFPMETGLRCQSVTALGQWLVSHPESQTSVPTDRTFEMGYLAYVDWERD